MVSESINLFDDVCKKMLLCRLCSLKVKSKAYKMDETFS